MDDGKKMQQCMIDKISLLLHLDEEKSEHGILIRYQVVVLVHCYTALQYSGGSCINAALIILHFTHNQTHTNSPKFM